MALEEKVKEPESSAVPAPRTLRKCALIWTQVQNNREQEMNGGLQVALQRKVDTEELYQLSSPDSSQD